MERALECLIRSVISGEPSPSTRTGTCFISQCCDPLGTKLLVATQSPNPKLKVTKPSGELEGSTNHRGPTKAEHPWVPMRCLTAVVTTPKQGVLTPQQLQAPRARIRPNPNTLSAIFDSGGSCMSITMNPPNCFLVCRAFQVSSYLSSAGPVCLPTGGKLVPFRKRYVSCGLRVQT